MTRALFIFEGGNLHTNNNTRVFGKYIRSRSKVLGERVPFRSFIRVESQINIKVFSQLVRFLIPKKL